jgi:hypothetical protein
MCEVAVSQRYDGPKGWNAKCSQWMYQQYVRCVFGVKIYNKRATRNTNGQFDRCMIVRITQPIYYSMISKFLKFFSISDLRPDSGRVRQHQ